MEKELIIGQSRRYDKDLNQECKDEFFRDNLFLLLDCIIDYYGKETINRINIICFTENDLGDDIVELTHCVHFIEPEHGPIRKLPPNLQINY